MPFKDEEELEADIDSPTMNEKDGPKDKLNVGTGFLSLKPLGGKTRNDQDLSGSLSERN